MQSAMHTGKEICLLTLVPPPTPLHTGTPLPWKSEPSITKISGYANGTYNTGWAQLENNESVAQCVDPAKGIFQVKDWVHSGPSETSDGNLDTEPL